MNMHDMERKLIEATLEQFGGHRAKTAEALGIGLRTLSGKLKAYGYAPRTKSFAKAASNFSIITMAAPYIKFEEVTVRAAGNTILENVSVELPAGSHVGIVGSSGAGVTRQPGPPAPPRSCARAASAKASADPTVSRSTGPTARSGRRPGKGPRLPR